MRVFLPLAVLPLLNAQIVFPPDLSVSRLEVVQTVQDDAQSVPLTAGKATGARAFVRQQGRPEALVGGVTVFLRGFRDGVEISGSPLRAVNGPITAVLQPDRANPDHSIDFILPADWTRAGRLELRAELRLPPNTPEGPADNNTLRREVEFVAAPVDELRVFWLPLCPEGAVCPPSSFPYQSLAARLLPLGDATLRYEDVPAPPVAYSNTSGLLGLLVQWKLFLEDSPLRVQHLVGWLARGLDAPSAAQRSAADRTSWILEQASPIANQRLLFQQLIAADARGGCEAVIQDTGFDVLGGRLIPAQRNRVTSTCDDASGATPWLAASDAAALTLVADRPRTPAAVPVWIVSGSVRRDGTGSLNAAYPGRSSFFTGSATGPACVVATAGGADLTPLCFQPAADGSFALRVPGATITRLRLTANNADLASLGSAGQAPTVQISTIQEGDSLTAPRLLQWTAADPLGRELTHAVFYSTDDGANWIPLAIGLRDAQFNIEPQYLLPGTVRFRVLASAGLDAGEAISAPVDIPRGARITLPDTTLSFGNATTGQLAERTLAVQNDGASPLEVSASASTSDVFRLGEPAPVKVRPGASRGVAFRYRPRIPGQETADLTVATNDPDNPNVNVSLRASAFERLVPNAAVDATLLDFGQVQVGQTRDLQVAVRNDGAAALNVTSLSTLNARFSAVAPAGSFPIAPGESRAVTARFTPLSGGAQTGTLNIATSDPTLPTLRVDLRGTGVQVFSPIIDVSPIRLDFSTLVVGQTSPILAVTVRNGGNGPLSIISLNVSNPAFAVLAPAIIPATVNPGAVQVVSLRFAPQAPGPQTGTLTIESSDPNRPRVTVELAGVGTAPSAAPEPSVSYVAPATLRPVPNDPATGRPYNIRFSITAAGSNFAPGAKLMWNGAERPTEVVSPTLLRGSLSPQDVDTPRENTVAVQNPAPGGGTSARQAVLVTRPPGTAPTAQIHQFNLSACPTVTSSLAVTNSVGLAITAINNSSLQCVDDGQSVPCTVRRALSVGSGLATVVVLHTSASILDRAKNQRDLAFQRLIATRFVEAQDETSVMQVTYMDAGVRLSPSTLEFKEVINRDALRDAINSISTIVPQGVGTALYDAIEDGLDRLSAQTNRRKALILFTASENTFDTRGPRDLNALFQRAQREGIPIYLIPVGDAIENTTVIGALNQFAVDSGGRVLIDRGSTISEEVNRLANELDNMHLVDFPARRDGQPHRMQINFTVGGDTFSTARVYPGCPRQ